MPLCISAHDIYLRHSSMYVAYSVLLFGCGDLVYWFILEYGGLGCARSVVPALMGQLYCNVRMVRAEPHQ